MALKDVVRALHSVKEDAAHAWQVALGGDLRGLPELSKSWINLERAIMEMDQECQTTRQEASAGIALEPEWPGQ